MQNVGPKERKMKRLFWLLPLVFAVSLSFSAEIDKSRTENDIREAVFRFQIHGWRFHLGKIFFLSFAKEQGDPSDEFMKRFAGYGANVRKGSQATAEITGVKDRNTGELGLILYAAEITWISDTEVEVKGGYYESRMSAEGNTYYLKRDDGRWIVTKEVVHWIS